MKTMSVDLKDLRIRCDVADDNSKTVYLPGGFPPGRRDEIQDKIGIRPTYINQPDNMMPLPQGASVALAPEKQKESARTLIKSYLDINKVTDLGGTKVADLIDKTPINFLTGDPWITFVKQHTLASAVPADTEGVTVTADIPVGNRSVQINQDFHTVAAIVHELFHALEHVKLRDLSDSLVEGMTEWLTLQATGLDNRTDMRGGITYEASTAVVKLAVKRGAVAAGDILAAYLQNDRSHIGRLEKAYDLYIAIPNPGPSNSFLTLSSRLAHLESAQW